MERQEWKRKMKVSVRPLTCYFKGFSWRLKNCSGECRCLKQSSHCGSVSPEKQQLLSHIYLHRLFNSLVFCSSWVTFLMIKDENDLLVKTL